MELCSPPASVCRLSMMSLPRNEETRQNGIAYMKKILDKKCTWLISTRSAASFTHTGPSIIQNPFTRKPPGKVSSIKSVRELADYAKPLGIKLTLETVNRFEQYMFNDAAEATQFVKDVDRDNVYVMLDSFHMNIEEDSFSEAIHTAGKYLGHFRT